MKNIIRLALVAAFALVCNTTFAQKMGYINMDELVMGMPERDSVITKLERLSKDFEQQLEGIQVEFNNKQQEYVKNSSTMSDAVKQMKEKELMDIQARFEESQRSLSEAYQKSGQEMMVPVIKKAEEALKKVSKAHGVTAVFNVAALAYYDEAALTNLLPLVKKELGIK